MLAALSQVIRFARRVDPMFRLGFGGALFAIGRAIVDPGAITLEQLADLLERAHVGKDGAMAELSRTFKRLGLKEMEVGR